MFVEKFGNVAVMIGDSEFDIACKNDGLEDTSGLADKVHELKDVIVEVVSCLSARIESGLSDKKPDEIELEIALSLSTGGNMWVLSGKGEGKIGLKLKWLKINQ